ncbi:hypothetical protein CRG98_027821 [Punica granatum]|uniref:Integrase catalytic domain-containing protein n=1 Tax=Punica granatum TaxID=22663 RepID=A0A2I0J6W5_PUNGR|nr:hypothetical protein CRG98_027821 [Punica granatum]
METISIDEHTSLLMGHEERRSYAATREQSQQLALAPLSGILGPTPGEVHYTNSRGMSDDCGYGYSVKAKNKGKGRGNGGNGSSYGGYGHGHGSDNTRNSDYGSTREPGRQGRPLSMPNPNFAGQYRGEQGRTGWNGPGYNAHPTRDTRAIRPSLFSQPGAFNLLGSPQLSPIHISLGPASASSPIAASILCQNCNRPSHTTSFCQFSYFSGFQAHIAEASSQGLHDLDWHMDSGATHHVTSNLANLNTHDETPNSDHIFVGDAPYDSPSDNRRPDLRHPLGSVARRLMTPPVNIGSRRPRAIRNGNQEPPRSPKSPCQSGRPVRTVGIDELPSQALSLSVGPVQTQLGARPDLCRFELPFPPRNYYFLHRVRIGAVLLDGRYYPIATNVDFPCTNNVAEYEACIIGLQAAIDFKTKDTKLVPYHEYLEELAENFEKSRSHTRRTTKNQFANALTTLASMGIDVIGPINPKASNGHLFILLAIDFFTKWIEAITLASITAKAVARFLKCNIIA